MKADARRLFQVLLALQIAVPLYQLGASGPARFGWQMFSRAPGMPVFEVRRGDGATETVNVRDLLVIPRQEIDYAAKLPPILCERHPDADEVVTHPSRRPGDAVRFGCP